MGRRCQVCHHPDHPEIDKRLLAGEAASAIARAYGGFSAEAVRRHLINHVQKPLHAVAVRAGAVKHAGAVVAKGGSAPMPLLALHDLVGTMQRNLARLERAADEAEGEKARLALAALSGQVSRAVEVAAKVSGVGAVDKTKDPVSIRIFIGAEKQVLVGARMAHEADSADTL